MFDRIQSVFKQERISFVSINGSMSRQQRYGVGSCETIAGLVVVDLLLV